MWVADGVHGCRFLQQRARGTRTLAEAWNGSSWSILWTPNVASQGQNVLSGVSCVSQSSCVAVGESYDNNLPGSGDPLVEAWNGERGPSNPHRLSAKALRCQAVVRIGDAVRCRRVRGRRQRDRAASRVVERQQLERPDSPHSLRRL